MVENVEQSRSERQRRSPAHRVRLEGKRQAKADENDTDVFDRAVGKETLEVLFHQCVEDTKNGSLTAEEKHDNARPPCRLAEQVEN